MSSPQRSSTAASRRMISSVRGSPAAGATGGAAGSAPDNAERWAFITSRRIASVFSIRCAIF
jgi:hypothetical protein